MKLDWRFIRDKYREEITEICNKIMDDINAIPLEDKNSSPIEKVEGCLFYLRREFNKGIGDVQM